MTHHFQDGNPALAHVQTSRDASDLGLAFILFLGFVQSLFDPQKEIDHGHNEINGMKDVDTTKR